MSARLKNRSGQGFITGTLVGTLGGLIGLGGAEFRLPILVGLFKLQSLEAVILNKATSLIVVAAALIFRVKVIPLEHLAPHIDVALNLLAGSLIGAWWAAGHAITMSRKWLDRIIMGLLIALSVVMFSEAWFGLHTHGAQLFESDIVLAVIGVLAGFAIGVVAALLGVAGGELLIPTIVILYGVDIKLAGSLSLVVSLPTMIVGFARYTGAEAFSILRKERPLLISMAVGSILGAFLGSLLLRLVPTQTLLTMLGIILIISAIKTFQHTR